MAKELTIQEAHEATRGISPAEVGALVVNLGIDEKELHDYSTTTHTATCWLGAIAMRAFVAGVLWEKSRD